MKKWMKTFYADELYLFLMLSIENKDYKAISRIVEEIKRSKTDIKNELFKLIRKHYCDDFNKLDPESRVLLLNFMKRHNIIVDNKEDIEL